MIEKEEIKYAFNSDQLKRGDILLLNIYDERLEEGMGTKYTHAAMYMGDAFILESDSRGVVMNHLFSYGFREKDDAIVLRANNASAEQIENIIFFARTKMGTEFNWREAKKAQKLKDSEEKDISNKMFCSRYVAQSYAKAGIQIVPNCDYCEPLDFIKSSTLSSIPNVLEEAEPDLINLIWKKSEIRESGKEMNLLTKLLKELRLLYNDPNIQSFEQLIEKGLKKPELDKQCIKIIEESQYFNYRENQKKDYPWIETNEAFAAYYSNTDDRLWFLLNQRLHFEKTFIPIYEQNARMHTLLSILFPSSELLSFLANGFNSVYSESQKDLERIYQLIEFTIDSDKDGCKLFFEKMHN